MTTDEALGGIWIAKDRDELSAHMDCVVRAMNMGRTSWDADDQYLIELACYEQCQNDFVRIVH